jgi:hypothetical protein
MQAIQNPSYKTSNKNASEASWAGNRSQMGRKVPVYRVIPGIGLELKPEIQNRSVKTSNKNASAVG